MPTRIQIRELRTVHEFLLGNGYVWELGMNTEFGGPLGHYTFDGLNIGFTIQDAAIHLARRVESIQQAKAVLEKEGLV